MSLQYCLSTAIAIQPSTKATGRVKQPRESHHDMLTASSRCFSGSFPDSAGRESQPQSPRVLFQLVFNTFFLFTNSSWIAAPQPCLYCFHLGYFPSDIVCSSSFQRVLAAKRNVHPICCSISSPSGHTAPGMEEPREGRKEGRVCTSKSCYLAS